MEVNSEIIDSSNYIAPFDTTVRSIGVHKATWTCYAGLTNKVQHCIWLKRLKCQEYWIVLRQGSDLDVIESECGFLEPDSTAGKITVTKDVQVDIDTTVPGNLLSICLPSDNPFPKLRASSQDTSSFPLEYYWTFRCDTCAANQYDTIEGQEVPYMWAKQAGWYEVRVRDPLNCVGDNRIRLVYDTYPEFVFDLDPYCYKYGQAEALPDFVVAPSNSEINQWEWTTNLGVMGTGDTLRVPNLIEGLTYTLTGTKPPIIPGAQRCSHDYEFIWSSDSFPAQEELYVEFMDEAGIQLCITDGDTGVIQVWEGGLRKKYSPMHVQWYKDTTTIPGQGYSLIVYDTGRYMVHIEDSLGCWNRDTTWVTHDERLPSPRVPCTVAGSAGIFTFEWSDETPEEVENWVSLDNGLTWIPASSGYQHIVPNVEKVKRILARGRLNSACEWTDTTISLECPDEVYPPECNHTKR